MARPIPARFYVNSGIVSSRTDIHNLLRPLVKQTVGYRYFRGRDLVAIGNCSTCHTRRGGRGNDEKRGGTDAARQYDGRQS